MERKLFFMSIKLGPILHKDIWYASAASFSSIVHILQDWQNKPKTKIIQYTLNHSDQSNEFYLTAMVEWEQSDRA